MIFSVEVTVEVNTVVTFVGAEVEMVAVLQDPQAQAVRVLVVAVQIVDTVGIVWHEVDVRVNVEHEVVVSLGGAVVVVTEAGGVDVTGGGSLVVTLRELVV